jgi:hypothetical protein
MHIHIVNMYIDKEVRDDKLARSLIRNILVKYCFTSPMPECVCRLYGVRATFNKVSVIPWWSVLLMEKAVARGENNRHAGSH